MDKALKIAILGNSSKNNISKYVWLEVLQDSNITYIPEINKNGLFRYCYRVLFNRHTLHLVPVLKIIKRAINHSIFAKLLVHDIPPKFDIIICTNASFCKLYPYQVLKKYKKKYNSRIVLFLYDTFCKIPKNETEIIIAENKKGFFDKIYSFDACDCSKYGFEHIVQCYTPIQLTPIDKPRYDVYFCGRNKGRLSTITSFLASSYKNEVKCFFRIPELLSKDKDSLLKCRPAFFEEQMLSYEETLKEMQHTNCILEIVQEGQHGISWRAVEAFAYNKKLLTNNEDIINNPFYNPEYIHVFKNIDDIDFNWVKEQIPINYHYHNEYSPIEFIRKVTKDLEMYFEK